MATIYLESTLGLSPAELWGKVRDVGAISEMLNFIDQSSLEGDVRSCTVGDGAEVSELILAIDDDHHRVSYSVTASPFPIEVHAASMQVFPAADGNSTLRWITDIKPDGLADGLGPVLTGAMTDLASRHPG